MITNRKQANPISDHILNGKKVKLRPPVASDLPQLYSYIYGTAHPEWRQFDAPYFPLEIITETQFAEKMQKHIALKGVEDVAQVLVIEADGKLIGEVSFYWEEKSTRWLEMGIDIYDTQYWNGGYGTEALKLWISYLFEHLDIARVGLTTWSGNPRMIACAEKLGMQMEGRMRKCRYYKGVYYDSIRMGLLRKEWE
jgi:RimJ/RimL family protein N-acetyltransferase